MENQLVQELGEIRSDLKHIKTDIDILKIVILEDGLLTEEERGHIEKTIESFRKGESSKFVSLEKA
ncbi:MAG TPA: hypothetical protein VJB06_01720 [archaeon]|nr:hypothetical protein [archaeon]